MQKISGQAHTSDIAHYSHNLSVIYKIMRIVSDFVGMYLA